MTLRNVSLTDKYTLDKGRVFLTGTECVRIDAEKQGAVDALLPAVLANGLADGKHVPFVERLVERGSTMSRSTEHDSLLGYRRRGDLGVVGSDEPGYVDQHGSLGGFSRRRSFPRDRFVYAVHFLLPPTSGTIGVYYTR
jgi:hypothetical protein